MQKSTSGRFKVVSEGARSSGAHVIAKSGSKSSRQYLSTPATIPQINKRTVLFPKKNITRHGRSKNSGKSKGSASTSGDGNGIMGGDSTDGGSDSKGFGDSEDGDGGGKGDVGGGMGDIGGGISDVEDDVEGSTSDVESDFGGGKGDVEDGQGAYSDSDVCDNVKSKFKIKNDGVHHDVCPDKSDTGKLCGIL